jgi:hypothetical protein
MVSDLPSIQIDVRIRGFVALRAVSDDWKSGVFVVYCEEVVTVFVIGGNAM